MAEEGSSDYQSMLHPGPDVGTVSIRVCVPFYFFCFFPPDALYEETQELLVFQFWTQV